METVEVNNKQYKVKIAHFIHYTTEKELFKNITDKIKQEIQTTVQKLKSKTKDEIVEERYQKFRKISGFKEV